VAHVPLERAVIRFRQMMPRAWPLTTDQVEHLAVGAHLDRAFLRPGHHRLVGAEQELLAGPGPRA
jgi:hypothetical protein